MSNCQKRMEYIRDRVTTDGRRSSPVQLPRALDAGTLVAARDESRVNWSIHADAAHIITGLAVALPLHLHVSLKVDHELAGTLERSCPSSIIRIISEHLVEESEAVLPDLQHTAMLLENESGERFQIA